MAPVRGSWTFFGKSCGTPRWSPDGSWIAFDGNLEGQRELYVVSASGGKPRQMTNHPALDVIPSWSHDGKWIYFCSDRSGRDEVWKIPAAGGDPVQVTKKGGHTAFESLDGKTLFYTKVDVSQLWRMPVEGGEEQEVLKSVYRRAFFPVKDGIWFIPGAEAGGRTPIQVHSFAGGGVKTVAATDVTTGMGLTASPDGRSVPYTQYDQAGSDLMLVENFR
jgi:Tol biopolymer transport system component